MYFWYKLTTGQPEDSNWHSIHSALKVTLSPPFHPHWWFLFCHFSKHNEQNLYIVTFLFVTSDADTRSLDFCSVPFVNCVFISLAYFFIWVSGLFGDINSLFDTIYPSCVPLNLIYFCLPYRSSKLHFHLLLYNLILLYHLLWFSFSETLCILRLEKNDPSFLFFF